MEILVLADDAWHPAERVSTGLDRLARFGFEFEWLDSAADWSAERMAAFPLVVLAKTDHVSSADDSPWLSARVERAFVRYVETGHGLLLLHSGAAACVGASSLCGLAGARFLGHPAECEVAVEPVRDHRLAAGCKSFTVVDEQYAMELIDDGVDVFATSLSRHGRQPAGWTVARGRGCVSVLTPGHEADVWAHPDYRRLLLNTLRWCGGAGVGSLPLER